MCFPMRSQPWVKPDGEPRRLRYRFAAPGEFRGLMPAPPRAVFGVALRAIYERPWMRIMCTLCARALGPHALALRALHNGRLCKPGPRATAEDLCAALPAPAAPRAGSLEHPRARERPLAATC